MITIEEKFEIYLLAPEDLIVSKISRFAQNDEEDIQNIINTGKVDKEKVYALADDAIRVGVGFREEWVRMNLDEVMEMF
ncbi:hypothetical protein GSY74_00045 [Sulfurovum sp. bin170]|nr:hypothetical protein [Sulfurovum sp. bin170]